MNTLLLDASNDVDIERSIRILAEGGLVALPTETVYGLAADAGNEEAVAHIFRVKGRPASHPLIVHVADMNAAVSLAHDWPTVADLLARRFWPGPLTLLVRKAAHVPFAVTGGRATVALRVPHHPVMQAILRKLQSRGVIGLAAPSANLFGSISPTTADHVMADLGGSIDAVVDGGECEVGVESTIVDCTGDVPRILRPGGLPAEDLNDALATLGVSCEATDFASSDPTIAIAPGMLPSHYAPKAKLEIYERLGDLEYRAHELEAQGINVAVLPHFDDPNLYSHELYANLRACDSGRPDVILALLPVAEGVGVAVRDRLVRAAADR